MSKQRPVRALLRWLLVAACIVVIVPRAHAAAGSCKGVQHTGRWTSVALPTGYWPDAAVSSSNADSMVVTDGRQIIRSADGGCTWKQVFALGATAAAPDDASQEPEYSISGFASPNVGFKPVQGDYLYALAIENTVGDLTFELPALIIASADGGKSWHESNPSIVGDVAGSGPRCLTYGTQLLVSPADPRTLTLRCEGTSLGDFATFANKCSTRYFTSHDAGATWTQLTPTYGIPSTVGAGPESATCATANLGWAGDQRDATHLLRTDLVSGTPAQFATRSSVDAGASYKPLFTTPAPGVSRDVRVDSAVGPDGSNRVLICSASGSYVSLDGGRTHWALPYTPPSILQQGRIFDCEFSPDGRSVLALQPVTQSDGSAPMNAFRFDIASRHWSALPRPPGAPRSSYPSASLHTSGYKAKPVFWYVMAMSAYGPADHLVLFR
jgi:hypothetical protein